MADLPKGREYKGEARKGITRTENAGGTRVGLVGEDKGERKAAIVPTKRSLIPAEEVKSVNAQHKREREQKKHSTLPGMRFTCPEMSFEVTVREFQHSLPSQAVVRAVNTQVSVERKRERR